MKTLGKFSLLFLFAAILLSSCTNVKVEVGEEAVLTEKPWFFGTGGIDTVSIPTGRQFVAFTTDYVICRNTPITYTEDFQNLLTSDHIPINFSAYAKIRVIPGKAPKLYKGFSADWYLQSVKETFRTMVRDKSCRYTMFDLASKREITVSVQDSLTLALREYVKGLGMPIDILSVNIGAVTPPDQVLTETKNTAAQNQNALTQIARKSAEDDRISTDSSKAIADRTYMHLMGMNVDQWLKYCQINVQKEMVDLIKEHQGVSVIINTNSGANVGNGLPMTYSANK